MSELITDGAYGTGLATVTPDGTVLDVWYPAPALFSSERRHRRAAGTAADRAHRRHPRSAAADRPEPDRLAGRRPGRHRGRLPAAAPAVRPAGPATVHQPGRHLRACCPTTPGPRSARSRRTTSSGCGCEAVTAGIRLSVFGVDKFPRMTDYVVPSGVRIAHADRVRLGRPSGRRHHRHARGLLQLQRRHGRHLDGRGPDLAGRHRRRRQRRRRRRVDHGHAVRRRQGTGHDRRRAACSGANSGVGISLGDDCVVEAGLYLTAGTKLTLKADGTGAGGQGPGAVRDGRTAVPAELVDRRGRGGAPLGQLGWAEHRPARAVGGSVASDPPGNTVRAHDSGGSALTGRSVRDT